MAATVIGVGAVVALDWLADRAGWWLAAAVGAAPAATLKEHGAEAGDAGARPRRRRAGGGGAGARPRPIEAYVTGLPGQTGALREQGAGLVAESAADVALLGTLYGAPPQDPFPGTPRQAPRAPARRRRRRAGAAGRGGRRDARARRRRHQPLIAREEAAGFVYRGAVPRGAPDLAEHARRARGGAAHAAPGARPRQHAAVRRDIDPLARRFEAASTAEARLDAAIALEAGLVRTYRAAVEQLTEPGILQTAATILAGHAQQHAILARAGRPGPVRRLVPSPRGRYPDTDQATPERERKTMPGSIGPMELIIVLVIALIVLGPRSCPRSGAPWARGCASSRTR